MSSDSLEYSKNEQYVDVLFNHGSWVPLNRKLRFLIGLTESVILSELLNYHFMHDGKFYFSRKQFKKEFNLSSHKARNIEKILHSLKLIKKEKKGPRTKNHYTVYPKNILKLLTHTSKYLKSLNKDSVIQIIINNYKDYKYKRVDLFEDDVKKFNNTMLKNLTHNIYNNLNTTNSFLKDKKRVTPPENGQPKSYPKISNPVNPVKPLEQPQPKYTKYDITSFDYKAYNEFVNLGATKHKKDKKAYSVTLEAIHKLFSPRCTNPYAEALKESKDKVLRKYIHKTWTLDEVLDTFKFYLKNSGKAKTVSSFIFSSFYGRKSYSPLVIAHKDMLKEKQRYEDFNGTAKIIMNVVDKKTGKARSYLPGLYIRTGALVDALTKRYSGNPNLLPPENDLNYQFTQFLEQKLDKLNFEVPFMCSDNFINEFVTSGTKNGVIIENSYLRS